MVLLVHSEVTSVAGCSCINSLTQPNLRSFDFPGTVLACKLGVHSSLW